MGESIKSATIGPAMGTLHCSYFVPDVGSFAGFASGGLSLRSGLDSLSVPEVLARLRKQYRYMGVSETKDPPVCYVLFIVSYVI